MESDSHFLVDVEPVVVSWINVADTQAKFKNIKILETVWGKTFLGLKFKHYAKPMQMHGAKLWIR